MPSNIDAGRRFQEKVRKALHKSLGRPFDLKVDVALPDARSHHFDLVTPERDIFVECRMANWQTGLTRVREAIDFLKALSNNPVRYIAVPFQKHLERSETFSQYVVRSCESRFASVGILEFHEESGKINCVHGELPTSLAILTADEIASFCRQLDRILDWVEEIRNRQDTREDRVAQLRSEGKVPKNIALQMHAVLQAAGGRIRDPFAVRAAWASIVDWARTEGCRATELTTPG